MVGQVVAVPEHLYKYRPFDKYAFDMLEKEELFLCRAENLDDKSECMATLSLDNYQKSADQLSFEVVEKILEFLRPFCTPENYAKAKGIVYRTVNRDGTVRPNYLMDAFPDLQALVPSVNVAPIITMLVAGRKELQRPENEEKGQKMIALAYKARQEMGICSLSVLPDSEDLWTRYAEKGAGYCVQYEITNDYKYISDIYPVVYVNQRNTDIFYSILYSMLGQYVYKLSDGRINPDKSQYIRLFLTKDKTEWGQQEEWRILGNANELIEAPKITSVRLGKNVSKENREKMEKFCSKRGILLLQ